MSIISRTRPKTLRGGQAIPIGSNLYYLRGRSHEQGGIDLGDVEAEGGEVMQVTPKTMRIFSGQPILNGISPAKMILGGGNPNQVFNAQEDFKDRFGFNDDGTHKAKLGLDVERYKSDVNYRKQVIAEAKASQKPTVKGNYNSPIFEHNDARITASEQGKMDRVNKQIADKERIDNGIKEGVKTIAENTPIIGDIITGIDISKDLKDKNYLSAGIGAASLLLPFGVGKAIKGFKSIKNAKLLAKNYDAAVNFHYNDKNIIHAPKEQIPDYQTINKRDNTFAVDRIRKAWIKEQGKLTPQQEQVLQNYDKTIIQLEDGTPSYTFNTDKVKIPNNPRTFAVNTRHEIGHRRRHLLGKTIDENQYDVRFDNYKDLTDTSEDVVRAQNDIRAFTSEEATRLAKAYKFSDDFIDNFKTQTGHDISKLLEKAETNADARDLLATMFENRFKGTDKYERLSEIEKVEKAIETASNTAILKALKDSNGYGYDFYNRFVKHADGMGFDVDMPDDELLESGIFEDKIFTPFINNIKEAMNGVGTVAGLTFLGSNLNNTKDKKAMGGLINRVPFTGKGQQTKTIARMGIKKKAELGTNYYKRLYDGTLVQPEIDNTTKYNVPITNNNVSHTLTRTRISTNTIPIGYETADFSDAYDNNINTTKNIVTKSEATNNTIENGTKFAGNTSDKSKSIFGDFTKSDLIGAGVNALGSLASYFINANAINNMTAPSQPIAKAATKLKTRININPQLDRMRETIGAYERNINQNTASSAVARNALNRVRFAGTTQVNQIYQDKENKETELINQDKLNRQQVAAANVDSYNQYQDRLTEFNNKIADLKGENAVGLVSGLNSSVQNMLDRSEQRRQFNNNVISVDLASPNVQKLMRKYGAKDIQELLNKIAV